MVTFTSSFEADRSRANVTPRVSSIRRLEPSIRLTVVVVMLGNIGDVNRAVRGVPEGHDDLDVFPASRNLAAGFREIDREEILKVRRIGHGRTFSALSLSSCRRRGRMAQSATTCREAKKRDGDETHTSENDRSGGAIPGLRPRNGRPNSPSTRVARPDPRLRRCRAKPNGTVHFRQNGFRFLESGFSVVMGRTFFAYDATAKLFPIAAQYL